MFQNSRSYPDEGFPIGITMKTSDNPPTFCLCLCWCVCFWVCLCVFLCVYVCVCVCVYVSLSLSLALSLPLSLSLCGCLSLSLSLSLSMWLSFSLSLSLSLSLYCCSVVSTWRNLCNTVSVSLCYVYVLVVCMYTFARVSEGGKPCKGS